MTQDPMKKSQRKGPGSPTGNRDKYASQQYRDTLSRWTHRLQSKEGFNLTDRSLGDYITKFIEYFESSTGQKRRVRDGDKNGYAGRWKAATTTPSFQQLEEDSWVLHFISFCMTGELYSDFNVTKYLESGNESLLPSRAWELKKIPLDISNTSNTVISSTDIESRLSTIPTIQDEIKRIQEQIKAIQDEMKFLNRPETTPKIEYADKIEEKSSGLSIENLENIEVDREDIESKLDFEPKDLTDARERIKRYILYRRGQKKFRNDLLKVYGGQCAITDCDAKDALEAAHIFPYRGANTNHVKNGLLLRADIHTLFDLYLISIDPNTLEVVISSTLLNTCYKELNGKPLKSPQDYAASPSLQALARHYETFLLKQNK